MEIRAAVPEDYKTIFEINAQAFPTQAEASLIDLLRQRPQFVSELSLVAANDLVIVGHILFTPIAIDSPTGQSSTSLALAPMAVLPEKQRNGIGSALVENGLSMAKKMNYDSVIVLGHPEFYPHFGFRPASAWGIRAPFEVPDEAFMALELTSGALNNAMGIVTYPKEFESV